MASNSLVTVSTLAKNNEKIKEQLATKVNINQGVDNKGKLLGVNDLGQVSLVDTPDSVKVSAESDNQIEQKQDGIFVKDMSTKISAEQDNALVQKTDGLYVPTVAEAKVSQEQNNIIISKDDGLFAEDAIVEIKVDGTVVQITDKTVDIALKAVTDLENYYDKEEVDDLLEAITTLNISVVDVLPTADISTTTIYLVAKTDTEQNIYSEYICLDATVPTWECIGDTEVDLTEYAKTDDVNTALELKADKTELDVYVTDTELTNKCYATETWVNEQGFLTQHQDLSNYATKDEIPTTLPANGGNSDTVNNHTVKSDVPENAVFTDTVYDDAALKTELTTAIATAKSEAIETILGEAVSEDFDTLQEVADWIQSDTTNSAELIIRVTNAESDIDTLEETISNKVDKVDGKGLSTNDFTDTYQSDVDGNTNARHTHSNTTVLDNTTASFTIEEKEKLSSIKDGAESSVSTVTGVNPTATNSTKAPIIYLKEDGYVEQKTLSGKNLLELKLTTATSDGITITRGSDGFVSFSGTATNNTVFRIDQSTVAGSDNLKDLNGEYTLSSEWSGTTNGVSIAIMQNATWEIPIGITSSSPKRSATIISEDCFVILKIDGGSTVNGKVRPMLRLTSNGDDTYEPYCGGVASPNPDYPQHISGAGDKGYFDGELLQGYYYKDDGNFSGDGNPSQVGEYDDICCKNPILVNENDSVLISYDGEVNAIRCLYYDESDTFISTEIQGSLENDGTTISKAEFTTPSNCKYIRFNLWRYAGITPSTAKHICVTINGMYALRVKTSNEDDTESTQAIIPVSAPLYEGDYIEVYADGSGKIVRENDTKVFDGSEYWDLNTEVVEGVNLYLLPKGETGITYTPKSAKSNLYRNDRYYNSPVLTKDRVFYIDLNNVIIRDNAFTSATELKTFLGSNNLHIVYKRNEPIETPLTAEQVEQFKKLYTFNDVTYINTDDGEVTVRYYCNTGGGGTVGMLQEQITSVESYIKALEERLAALEKC